MSSDTENAKPWWWDTERCPNCKDQHAAVCGCFDDDDETCWETDDIGRY